MIDEEYRLRHPEGVATWLRQLADRIELAETVTAEFSIEHDHRSIAVLRGEDVVPVQKHRVTMDISWTEQP